MGSVENLDLINNLDKANIVNIIMEVKNVINPKYYDQFINNIILLTIAILGCVCPSGIGCVCPSGIGCLCPSRVSCLNLAKCKNICGRLIRIWKFWSIPIVVMALYGILNDMRAVRICPEYFTIGHIYGGERLVFADDLNVQAIVWGIMATIGALCRIWMFIVICVTMSSYGFIIGNSAADRNVGDRIINSVADKIADGTMDRSINSVADKNASDNLDKDVDDNTMGSNNKDNKNNDNTKQSNYNKIKQSNYKNKQLNLFYFALTLLGFALLTFIIGEICTYYYLGLDDYYNQILNSHLYVPKELMKEWMAIGKRNFIGYLFGGLSMIFMFLLFVTETYSI